MIEFYYFKCFLLHLDKNENKDTNFLLYQKIELYLKLFYSCS